MNNRDLFLISLLCPFRFDFDPLEPLLWFRTSKIKMCLPVKSLWQKLAHLSHELVCFGSSSPETNHLYFAIKTKTVLARRDRSDRRNARNAGLRRTIKAGTEEGREDPQQPLQTCLIQLPTHQQPVSLQYSQSRQLFEQRLVLSSPYCICSKRYVFLN